jgi:hypothetical protein
MATSHALGEYFQFGRPQRKADESAPMPGEFFRQMTDWEFMGWNTCYGPGVVVMWSAQFAVLKKEPAEPETK